VPSTVATAAWAATTGPQAQAQALGAAEALRHGTYWNAPQLPGHDGPLTLGPGERERLRLILAGKPLSRQTWLDAVDAHLRGRHINATPGERALDLREDVLDERPDVYLDIDDWLTAIAATGADNQWPDLDIDAVCRAAVKAFHIERQLTDDGLLPAGTRVWTYLAYDIATATSLAQSGFRLGFADGAMVGQILDAARANAGAVFADWAQFGASYAAARSSLHGSYPCDDVWREATGAVATLLADPTGPWTALEFPTGEPA